MTTRFRTQDTRSSTAKKLNALLAGDTVAANFFSFREVPQTYDQWDAVLEGLRKAMYAAFYPVEPVGKFRTADTRRLRAFKLNRFAEAVVAGPQEFVPVVLGSPAITLAGGATAVEVGASLVVVPALWRANPTATVTYKWQSSADGETWADIAGETSTTYTLLEADEGALIRAVATGTNSEGAASANTNVLGPVAAGG